MKHSNKFLPTIWWKYHTKTCKVSLSTGMFVSMYSHNELDQVFRILCKISETVQKMTNTNSPIWCQLITKTTWKCNTVSFGPVCQLWFATFKGKSDSKPQSCIQQHKPSKVTRNATNENKHINKASKQTFANNLLQIPNKYTHGMLSHWKICFNVFNLQK